jgi:LemA protein
MFIAVSIVAPVLLLIVIYFVLYNSLVGRKNQVENAFAGIDVQLKKRHDLIPNLIASAKNYMKHEREVLEKVTAMRQKAISSNQSPESQVQAENQLTGALKGLLIAVENYPDLKADGQFDQLMRSLNEVESQISAARRAYNAAATEYNNGIEMFPSSLVASRMNYSRKTLFEIPDQERENVDVNQMFQ